MAKSFNKYFWRRLYEEWDRLHSKGATVKEFKDRFGEMLAEEDSEPLPGPPPAPPPPDEDEP